MKRLASYRLVLMSLASLAVSSCFSAWPLDGLYRCGGGCPEGMVCDDGVCCREGGKPACPTLVPASGRCADGGAPKTYYADRDGDGFGTPAVFKVGCSRPVSESYVDNSDDCDDAAPEAYPGGQEVCDGRDNNCDGTVDEGQSPLTTYYRDLDGDSYGEASQSIQACQCPNGCTPPGYADKTGDCGPMDPARYPGAPERCNGLDDDCNGPADDGTLAAPIGQPCTDAGIGLCGPGVLQCKSGAPACVSSYVPTLDVCDLQDNDCDGQTDEQPDCGGPTSLLLTTGQGFNGAQDTNATLSFTNQTTACLKDYDGGMPTPDVWNRPQWIGGGGTHHLWWAEAPAGKTWDLSNNPKLYLELAHSMTGNQPSWDGSKQPVVYVCGIDGRQMLRLVHIPSTLLGPPPGVVRTTIDFANLGPTGWDRGTSTGLDLTKVKRIEVLVKPAPRTSTADPIPTFTITWAADAGFVR